MKKREQWFAVNEMMNYKIILLMLLTSFSLVSCSKVLVRPELEITKREKRISKQEYQVVEKFLTSKEIGYLNKSTFPSKVKIYDESSNSQKIINLEDFSREILPSDRLAKDYVLAPGDVISISRSASDLGTNASLNSDPFFSENLKIDSAGFVKTIDGIQIKVSGLTLTELESSVETALRSEEYLYQDQVVEKLFPIVVPESYRLGSGDILALTRLMEVTDPENGRTFSQPISYEIVIEQDGSIQFIELDGRIMLSGQTLQEAHDTIRRELLRSGLSTSVTLTLTEYASQTVSITGEFGPSMAILRPGFNTAGRVVLSYFKDQADNAVKTVSNHTDYFVKLSRGKDFFGLRLSTLLNHFDKESFILQDGDSLEVIKIRKNHKSKAGVEKFSSSYVTLTQDVAFDVVDLREVLVREVGLGKTLRIFLNDKNLSMYDIVSRFGYWPDPGEDNLLHLTRNNKNYRFSANAIIERGPNSSYYLKRGDIIELERANLIGDRVYVFGEVDSIKSLTVSQTDRPYLSEVLEDSGAFDLKEADIRHIYVLRRENLGKFNAFRFDVSNMVNFALVEKLEMRPSDIVLVRTLPLYRFNRFINAVFGIGGNALGSINAFAKTVEEY